MTPHPDEQARELRERLDQFIDREGEWDTKDAADKEIAAAFARVRLAEAELIRDEYLDAGGWELVNKEDFDKHVAELVRQAAGENDGL